MDAFDYGFSARVRMIALGTSRTGTLRWTTFIEVR